MVRQARAITKTGDFHEGLRTVLYGPDANGTLDNTTPVAAGERSYTADRIHRGGWGESAWGLVPWGEEVVEYAGWGEFAWGEEPWGEELRTTAMFGERHESGRFEYASQVEDEHGNVSSVGTTGTLNVRSAPEAYDSSVQSESSGTFTVTITEKA